MASMQIHDGSPLKYWLEVDWVEPWYAGVADHARACMPQGTATSVADLLNARLKAPVLADRPGAAVPGVRIAMPGGRFLRFVSAIEQSNNRSYEQFIHDTGRVPTRDNWHDAFNGLAWLSYPATRRSLLQRQVQAQQQADLVGMGSGRGTARDAATLFDENGLILACSNARLAQALRQFDWPSLFIAQRSAFQIECEAWVLGHGLMEQLMQPFKSLTAHVLIVPVDPDYFRAPPRVRRDAVDRMAAAWFDSWPFLKPTDFCPLPVLGIPGWWPENTDPAFYADAQVFRSGRLRASQRE